MARCCVAVNKDNSSTTLFTLSQKPKAGTITLGGTPLKEDEGAYPSGHHILQEADLKAPHCQGRGKGLTQAGCPSQSCWNHLGSRRENTETLHQATTVRPHLECGSSAWSATAKTNHHALDKVQNQTLRLIIVLMQSLFQCNVQLLGPRRVAGKPGRSFSSRTC